MLPDSRLSRHLARPSTARSSPAFLPTSAPAGRIDADWIAEQVRFCDNTGGDIDTLVATGSGRSGPGPLSPTARTGLKTRHIGATRPGTSRTVCRDALHERLTQRFVDRRTSVLIRHLRDKRMVSPEINDRGEVCLEGHLIGTIEGFRFTLARSEGEADAKGLRAAAARCRRPRNPQPRRAPRRRAQRGIRARRPTAICAGAARSSAEIAEGDDILAPRVLVLADESLTGPDLERVQDRLGLWLRHLINTQLDQIIAAAQSPPISRARPAASPSSWPSILASCRAPPSPTRSRASTRTCAARCASSASSSAPTTSTCR